MSDSCLINDRFREQAEKVRSMLRERVQAARDYVTEKLGFDGWSRDLHDHMECYAFLIPEELYSDWAMVGYLKKFIEDVFYTHFLDVPEVYIMPNSSYDSVKDVMGENSSGDKYTVDWCGSRCRDVDLGPHIYFRLCFDGWVSDRIRHDPVVPKRLAGLRWEVETDYPSQYETKQWAVQKAPSGADARI